MRILFELGDAVFEEKTAEKSRRQEIELPKKH
jgi:hypothetical protein